MNDIPNIDTTLLREKINKLYKTRNRFCAVCLFIFLLNFLIQTNFLFIIFLFFVILINIIHFNQSTNNSALILEDATLSMFYYRLLTKIKEQLGKEEEQLNKEKERLNNMATKMYKNILSGQANVLSLCNNCEKYKRGGNPFIDCDMMDCVKKISK